MPKVVMEDCVVLNSGWKMPRIGLGVYMVDSNSMNSAVETALRCGYRLFDTAQLYGNEAALGAAIRNSGIAREEVFITTKLWGCRGYKDAKASIKKSLNALNLQYIDLLLIHEPSGAVVDIYRAMEEAQKEGYIKSLGVSNFREVDFMKIIKGNSIVPAVNQVEAHVFTQQYKIESVMKKYGTVLEAWCPLVHGKDVLFENEILQRISRHHQKTIPQIALRFLYQRNIVVIPKSSNAKRIEENHDILDFELSLAEMDQIKELDQCKSLFPWYAIDA